MTLNLTVLTRRVIYQAADFRLTDAANGSLIDDASHKIVTYSGRDWDGFVTYTGVGRVDGRETASLVADWLSGDTFAGPDQVASRLAKRGTELLARIARATGSPPYRHTFVVAGFNGGSPMALVISNFEHADGRPFSRTSEALQVSQVRLGPRTRLLVNGQASAIPAADRRILRNLIEQRDAEPGFIRDLLQNQIRATANSPMSRGLVSPESLVYSFDETGQGTSLSSEGVPGFGHQVALGVDLSAQAADVAREVFGESFSMRTLAMGRLGGGRPSEEACALRVDALSASDWELRELRSLGASSAWVRCISETGWIAGELSLERGRAPLPFVWHSAEQDPVPLPMPEGAFGYSRSVNVHGDVVGGCVTPAAANASAGALEHAWIWVASSDGRDLDGRRGFESSAYAINASRTVVGRMRTHPGQTNSENVVVAWIDGEPIPVRLEAPSGVEASAGAIDGSGIVVVNFRRGFDPAGSALWRPGNDLTPVSMSAVVALTRIDSSGRFLLGLALDGTHTSVLWDRERDEVAEIASQPAISAVSVNSSGTVVGFERVGAYDIPWVKPLGADREPLPTVRYHNAQPAMVNDRSEIVGVATADHGAHALVWEPKTGRD